MPTTGSFTATHSVLSDSNVGSSGVLFVITTAAVSAWVPPVGGLYDSLSVFNPDPTFALVVNLSVAATATTVAGDRDFLVPPQGMASWTSELPVISGVSLGYVDITAPAGGSVSDSTALIVVAPAARRNVIVNVGRK